MRTSSYPCPQCNGGTQTYYSKKEAAGRARKRKCNACGFKFNTIQSDGQAEAFTGQIGKGQTRRRYKSATTRPPEAKTNRRQQRAPRFADFSQDRQESIRKLLRGLRITIHRARQEVRQ